VRRDRDSGAAAVEFALILPILILLIFGLVQFGLAYNRLQGMQAAAREGARVASLPSSSIDDIRFRIMGSSTSSAEGALKGVMPNTAAYSNVRICVTTSSDCTPTTVITSATSTSKPCAGNGGDKVLVKLTYPNTIDIPLWPGSPATTTLTGKGEFRCEYG
jgi:Flp pilus assembly protein TadG